MEKTTKQVPMPRCGHPVLATFSKAFIETINTSDPVEAAGVLAAMSKSWKNPAKRRQALAARIALLGEGSLVKEENPPVLEETIQEVEAEEPAIEPPAPTKKAAAKAIPPTISRRETANLLAQFDQPDTSEFESEPENSTHSEYGKAPPQSDFASDQWLRDLPDSNSSQGSNWSGNFGDGSEGNLLNERSLDGDDDMNLTRKKDTMTDLSLAILTGVFKKPPEDDAQTEADKVEPQELAPIVTTADLRPKPSLSPDLSSLFSEMAADEDMPGAKALDAQTPAPSDTYSEPPATETIPADAILRESEETPSAHKATAKVVEGDRAAQFRSGFETEDETPEVPLAKA